MEIAGITETTIITETTDTATEVEITEITVMGEIPQQQYYTTVCQH